MSVSAKRAGLCREDGQGLVELIVSLVILAVGIGSLLTLLTSSALSLQRSDQKGTALVLAERQIELYRSVGYKDIRLDDASVSAIAGSDKYVTANSSDSTIPSASGQALDTDATRNACASPLPVECQPIQTVTGPDHRQYRIDTYIHAENPQGGDEVAKVTVVVRNAGDSSLPILARSASTFSAINIANVSGKSITKMTFSAPTADMIGVNVDASMISATISNGSSPSGLLSFFVLPAPAVGSSPCTGGTWTQVGTATVSGNGTYHPSGAGYTPPIAGTYYWYATYSGDSANKKTQSVCGSIMPHMTVQSTKWSPTLSLATTASTGIVNTAISGSTLTGTVAASSGTTTAAITYMVYGPSASAPATCTTTVGGFWSQVGTLTPSGNGSYSPTTGFTPTSTGTYWYFAKYPGDATNNAASSTCSSSMAKTVVSSPPDTFGFSNITSPTTAGTQFTVATITAQLYSGGTDTSYTGTKTLTFTGPGTSAKGNAPTYPASVTFTNGVASNVPITLFKAETTALTATQGLITGTSNSFTVNGLAASAFTIDTVGTQVAGTAFGVTVRAVDSYGNAATYTGSHTLSWTTSPGNSPNGTAPTLNAGTATNVTFTSGSAIPTGLVLVNASSASSLTVTEGTKTGTSANFTVSAADPTAIAFINCTKPSNPNATCAGSPFSTGNNGTLKANIGVTDTYGNTAVATSAMTITLTSSSTTNYTVSPSPVTISAGGSQSNQLTVTPAKSNPSLTTITAHVTSGGGFSDKTVQVKK
jgi:type II secretory pathway pseudopilin PulG